jgi:hypothetical protein
LRSQKISKNNNEKVCSAKDNLKSQSVQDFKDCFKFKSNANWNILSVQSVLFTQICKMSCMYEKSECELSDVKLTIKRSIVLYSQWFCSNSRKI